jgi:hypothetical protein
MVGKMSTRIDVEVPGRHNVPVVIAVREVLADGAGHSSPAGHRERTAFAEVILDINDY